MKICVQRKLENPCGYLVCLLESIQSSTQFTKCFYLCFCRLLLYPTNGQLEDIFLAVKSIILQLLPPSWDKSPSLQGDSDVSNSPFLCAEWHFNSTARSTSPDVVPLTYLLGERMKFLMAESCLL